MKLAFAPEPTESGVNVTYILRVSATGGEPDRVWTYGLPEEVTADRDYLDFCHAARLWADDRMEDELERAGAPDGRITITRRDGSQEIKLVHTHLRMVFSFDRAVSDADARALVDRWTDEQIGTDRRSICAIHRDTGNTHAHQWVDARRPGRDEYTRGNKIRIPSQTRAREAWARIVGERYGKELEREYVDKARETTEARHAYRRYMEAKEAAEARGEPFDASPPPLPKRARWNSRAARQMERAQYDNQVERSENSAQSRDIHIESAARGDQRQTPIGDAQRDVASRSGDPRERVAEGEDRGARAPSRAHGSGARAGRDAREREPAVARGGETDARGGEATSRGDGQDETQALTHAMNAMREEFRRGANTLALTSARTDERDRGSDRGADWGMDR